MEITQSPISGFALKQIGSCDSLPAMRFVSFMDILGFADLVESSDLDVIIQRMRATLSMVPVVLSLGHFRKDAKTQSLELIASLPKLNVFSFSDTFVLASHDDSAISFFQVVVGSALFAKYLFAASLPVRGAITCGEAEYIPGTSHLVGRAVIRAARLEKQQDWFGVIVDPEILTSERQMILSLPLVKPLVVQYAVPLKPGTGIINPCTVINWRFNLEVQQGTGSLFPNTSDSLHSAKRDNTLAFCRWLRDNNLAYGHITAPNGTKLNVPWLATNMVGPHQPGTPGAEHGDAY